MATCGLPRCLCVFFGPSCGLALHSCFACPLLQKLSKRSGPSSKINSPLPGWPARRPTCSFYRVLPMKNARTLRKRREFEGPERPPRRRRPGLSEPSSLALGQLRPPRPPAGGRKASAPPFLSTVPSVLLNFGKNRQIPSGIRQNPESTTQKFIRGGRLRRAQGAGREACRLQAGASGPEMSPPRGGRTRRPSAFSLQASGPRPTPRGGRPRRAHRKVASEMGGVAPHRASSIYIYMYMHMYICLGSCSSPC